MEVEKISAGGVTSYQGSPTAQKVSAAQSVEASEAAAEAVQALEVSNVTAGTEPEKDTGAAEDKPISDKQLKKAVNELNKRLDDSEAVFGIHDKTNRVTIKIVDKTTKKVIKEYPPEQTLDMIAKVWEIAGILVDEKL